MELWELDNPGNDDHVSTLEYGNFDVDISCSGPWTCSGQSAWRLQHSVDETGVTARARIRVSARAVDAVP